MRMNINAFEGSINYEIGISYYFENDLIIILNVLSIVEYLMYLYIYAYEVYLIFSFKDLMLYTHDFLSKY